LIIICPKRQGCDEIKKVETKNTRPKKTKEEKEQYRISSAALKILSVLFDG
jgi:hypothetical protein